MGGYSYPSISRSRNGWLTPTSSASICLCVHVHFHQMFQNKWDGWTFAFETICVAQLILFPISVKLLSSCLLINSGEIVLINYWYWRVRRPVTFIVWPLLAPNNSSLYVKICICEGFGREIKLLFSMVLCFTCIFIEHYFFKADLGYYFTALLFVQLANWLLSIPFNSMDISNWIRLIAQFNEWRCAVGFVWLVCLHS